MTTEGRLGVVRRWYEDRGFGFLRTLITKEEGTTRNDGMSRTYLSMFRKLKKAGLKTLAERDVLRCSRQPLELARQKPRTYGPPSEAQAPQTDHNGQA